MELAGLGAGPLTVAPKAPDEVLLPSGRLLPIQPPAPVFPWMESSPQVQSGGTPLATPPRAPVTVSARGHGGPVGPTVAPAGLTRPATRDPEGSQKRPRCSPARPHSRFKNFDSD